MLDVVYDLNCPRRIGLCASFLSSCRVNGTEVDKVEDPKMGLELLCACDDLLLK